MSGDARGHVAVVGGGISGLTAGYLAASGGVRVTVLEGASRPGGKLAVSDVAGVAVDEGAEALLARRPEGLELIGRLGLTERLVYPTTTAARIWSRGALRPLPAGQVMGIPADLSALAEAELLSPSGLLRVPLDLVLPATRGAPGPGPGTGRDADVSVADYVGARLGRELVDRLVEPLLGGVYAGRVEDLSFTATMPAVAGAARTHRSLIMAARSVQAAGPARPGPVFATVRGGLGGLPAVLAARIAELGGTVRTRATVREVRRTPAGWRLTIGSACSPERLDADAVIIAVPARSAARLLAADVPAAAAELAGIDCASMAIVTLAYAADAPDVAAALRLGSGYLVPAVEGRAVKAVTFSSAKWPHLRPRGMVPAGADAATAGSTSISDAPDISDMSGISPAVDGSGAAGLPPHASDAADRTDIRDASDRSSGSDGEAAVMVVRCSIGRYGEEHLLQRDDAELVALATAELAATSGLTGRPIDTRVTRWGGGLPQYSVGHRGRVARIRAAVADQPGLAVCGAAYDGLGIPACVATAKAAVGRVLDHLARGRERVMTR